jgi:hypothetical protein
MGPPQGPTGPKRGPSDHFPHPHSQIISPYSALLTPHTPPATVHSPPCFPSVMPSTRASLPPSSGAAFRLPSASTETPLKVVDWRHLRHFATGADGRWHHGASSANTRWRYVADGAPSGAIESHVGAVVTKSGAVASLAKVSEFTR